MEVKNIAILTSGGDAQGMNTAINIVVRVARARRLWVYGVLEGYKGLYNDQFIQLDEKMVENISSIGGSFLKTSRFEDFKKPSVVKKSAENLKKHNIDALIILGGDGSFRGALELINEGIKVVCIPATIDNDLRYTSRCLGFDTAVNNSCKFIENVKQTMSSLSRGVVFEVMGRYCGDIALYSACSTACDIIAVPEKPTTEKEIIDKVKLHLKRTNTSPTLVIAEHQFDVVDLAKKLTKETGVDFKYSIVGYIQRGGSPSVLDKALAMQFGVKAIDLIEKGMFNRAIGYRDDTTFDVDLKDSLNCEYNFNYDLLQLFYSLNEKN